MDVNVTLVGGLLAIGAAIIGGGLWLGRVSTKAESAAQQAHSLANKLQAFQVEVAKEYVTKDLLSDLKRDITDGFKQLGERIDKLMK